MLKDSLLDGNFLVQATDDLTRALEDDNGQEFNHNFFNENDTNKQRSACLQQFTGASMKASIEPTLGMCQWLLGKSGLEILPFQLCRHFLWGHWQESFS